MQNNLGIAAGLAVCLLLSILMGMRRAQRRREDGRRRKSGMKFWMLVSVMRGEEKIIREEAGRNPEWKYVVAWLDEFDNLVETQDRTKLDAELPNELVRASFGRSKIKFYLSKNGWLRSYRKSKSDKELSAIETYDRFGGEAMDQASEYGSVKV
jgi:hypothetical protein